MMPRQRCTFCERPAIWHHVAGRNHCTWFLAPLCRFHHQKVTIAYYKADPNMMRATPDIHERIRRAREACLVFLWLLEHPDEIDPGILLD